MKNVILTSIALAALILTGGCEPDGGATGPSSRGTIPPGVKRGFAPARVQIMGLTDIASPDTSSLNTAKLNVYVDILDPYDSRIKSPGIFRFELYKFVPRSSDPRGERIIHWPDIDLTDPDLNNEHWQDYLRTYRFKLDMDFHPTDTNTFILEATFITAHGKHLTKKHKLEYHK